MSQDNDTYRWRDSVPGAHRRDLTDPATQIVSDRDDYLGQGRNDLGRRIAEDQVELFVTGAPAAALQREFEQHQPLFVAVHDLCTSASLRLLASLAGASGAPVQRLTVRQQGLGAALAVLQFVEVPLADGTVVRLYSTEAAHADAPARQALALTLLTHSQLGVLIAGEAPPAALAAALQPLHDAFARGPWPNRELLVVPLGTGAALATLATQLAGGTTLSVHVTPRASLPRHVWTFVAGTWNRLFGGANHLRAMETEIERAVPRPAVPWSEATTNPMPLRGAAAAEAARPTHPRAMPSPGATRWQAYVDQCAAIKGVYACCVFDVHSAIVLATSGTAPAAERLAEHGAALLTLAANATRALGLGRAAPEAVISTSAHHLLLRPVPGHPGVALHAVVSAHAGNPALVRMQFERIEAPA